MGGKGPRPPRGCAAAHRVAATRNRCAELAPRLFRGPLPAPCCPCCRCSGSLERTRPRASWATRLRALHPFRCCFCCFCSCSGRATAECRAHFRAAGQCQAVLPRRGGAGREVLSGLPGAALAASHWATGAPPSGEAKISHQRLRGLGITLDRLISP